MITAAGDVLATIERMRANRAPRDHGQEVKFSAQFNEAVMRLTRLRLEIDIIGPNWARKLAREVESGSNQLTTTPQATRGGTTDSFSDFSAMAAAFVDARSTFQEEATKQLSDTHPAR